MYCSVTCNNFEALRTHYVIQSSRLDGRRLRHRERRLEVDLNVLAVVGLDGAALAGAARVGDVELEAGGDEVVEGGEEVAGLRDGHHVGDRVGGRERAAERRELVLERRGERGAQPVHPPCVRRQ